MTGGQAMKSRILRVLSMLWLLIWLAPGLAAVSARPQPASNVTLAEIDLGLSGQTLMDWYVAQTSHTNASTYFGAYITLPVADYLYVGLASARPAEDSGDGSYFAILSGTTSLTLTGIAEPNEQGLHEMIYDGSLVHIAGTDPHPDDWTAGNHYTYSLSSNTFVKNRDSLNGLINVQHTWGLWKESPTSTLYAAVGATTSGQIFASNNDGFTWTKKSDLGNDRAYDITGFNGGLYAIYNDVPGGALTMTTSLDGGANWNTITDLAGNLRRVHLLEFDHQLLAVSYNRDALYALDITGTVTTHTLPTGYLVGASYPETSYTDYNVMAVAGNYLYLIAEQQSPAEQAIIRTSDLSSWERLVHTSEKLISLAYWPDKNWLITATPGTAAKLWKVDLSGTPTAVTLRVLRAQEPARSLAGPVFLVLLTFLGWRHRAARRR
jgi:hypothetical protein